MKSVEVFDEFDMYAKLLFFSVAILCTLRNEIRNSLFTLRPERDRGETGERPETRDLTPKT